jgi:hypothetical protein
MFLVDFDTDIKPFCFVVVSDSDICLQGQAASNVVDLSSHKGNHLQVHDNPNVRTVLVLCLRLLMLLGRSIVSVLIYFQIQLPYV